MKSRFSDKRYTDSDVIALYMKYRERNIGKFTREVGDFIAHSKRDRGATLEKTAYAFSQLAFFQTFQGKDPKPLEHKGPCGWWLKHYLLEKTAEASDKQILESTKLTKKELRNKIKNWFPRKELYPTQISCEDPETYFRAATLFSRTISGQSVFQIEAARKEIESIFNHEGIQKNEVEPFIVATAVILNNRTVEIVPGVSAEVRLFCHPTRSIPTGKGGRWPGDPCGWEAIHLPDGNLKIVVHCKNITGDGLVGTVLDFLDTGIDTEAFFFALADKDK